MDRSGQLIVLEGLDGCGKSTQAQRLTKRIQDLGLRVVHTREPGGTKVGERIRDVLLDPALGGVDARAEVFLYQAARAQLVAEVIRPALARGDSVVCERWHYATMAYQTVASADDEAPAPPEMVRETSAWATGGTEPDRAVLLDMHPDQMGARLDRPLDRVESRGGAYRAQVAAAYREIFGADPGRLRIVAARGTKDEVEQHVWEAVRDCFEG